MQFSIALRLRANVTPKHEITKQGSDMKAAVHKIVALTVALGAIAPAEAQIIAQRLDQNALMLPSNTLVYVALNSDLTSKRIKQGDTFDMTVTRPVIYGDYVVIPAGSLAHGRVAWRTGRGAFGKSAKMDVDLVDVQVGDTTVPITGHYKLTGDGNTGWTLGAVAVVGLWGGFVTGKSATAPQGTEWKGFTQGAVAFATADNRGNGPTTISGRGSNLSSYEAGKRAAAIQMSWAGKVPGSDDR